MIPVSLKIQNFMAYKEECHISFEAISTACLCGPNGSGKSSAFEALTWALWGKTRAKSDEDLIHLGQKQAEVAYEFEAGISRYRVTRKRSRAKSANSSLGLEVLREGVHEPIGGATMAETQQIINNLLHLDYQTFTNSAFLRQGHADELTIKPPAERKKVLADILDLSQYDRLEEIAKGYAKERLEYLQVLEVEIDHWREEVSHKAECEQQLSVAHEREGEVVQNAAEVGIRAMQLKEKSLDLDQKRQWLAELQRKERLAVEQLAYWRSEVAKLSTKTAEHRQVLTQREDILFNMERLAKTRQEIEEQDEKFKRLVELKEHRAVAENKIASEEARIKAEVASAKKWQTELVEQADASQINDMLSKWQAYLEDVEKVEAALSTKRQAVEDVHAEGTQLKGHILALQDMLEGARRKLEMFLQGDAACPLCNHPLDAEERAHIETSYRSEVARLQAEVQSSDVKLSELRANYTAMKAEVTEREQELVKGKTDAHANIARLGKELEIAEKAAEDLESVEAQIQIAEECLRDGESAMTERYEADELNHSINILGYDERAHDEARQLAKGLQPVEESHRNLQEAERLLPEEEAGFNKAKEQVEFHADEAETARAAQGDYVWVQSDYDALVEDIKDAEREEAQLRTEQAAVEREIGSLQQKLQDIANAEKQAEEHRQCIGKAQQERQVFEDLAVAFGKKGIQALIIDAAIPEIEIEANRLLGQMTDNRMGLILDTQRETKKGDTVETLDISIWDELGTRSYEMYSGGEAFRINFALRIALSRMLANRAGAPLSVLIVDEGFGSQDADGLDKVIGAINSIQDEFDKIIVVTHLDELKNAFPDRIEVAKTEQGSVILSRNGRKPPTQRERRSAACTR